MDKRLEWAWEDYCANIDKWEEENSPEYRAEQERQLREMEKNPEWGIF